MAGSDHGLLNWNITVCKLFWTYYDLFILVSFFLLLEVICNSTWLHVNPSDNLLAAFKSCIIPWCTCMLLCTCLVFTSWNSLLNNFLFYAKDQKEFGWTVWYVSARAWLEIVAKAGFFCFRFPLNPLRFTSDQTNWDKCLLFNFAKLQFFNDKIDQNTHFAKLPSAKCIFYCNFEIEVLS